jgi:glyoxylase-like metal-dependent hydrolase (beta-lactamase superfamily II)
VVSYTGDVAPGGAADTRELDSLTITKVAVDDQMSNNCYLVTCKHTGEAVLIDAAAASDTLLSLIGSTPVTHVLTTHQHWDHHRALADVVEATGASTVAGVPDAAAITEQTGVPIAIEVEQGDTVPVGDCTLEVIALAGHTPGSIALLYRDPAGTAHLFTGDSLFPGGHGKTATEEHHHSLMDDLEHKVFSRLDDDTHVYPGHGDDTTLGAERPHLPEWRERGW